ncbi:MAG TPA: A/G-specific adenine glycosylase [Pirellulales bacterium]|nr:A/G-specific adenine glycosylase [Pirellulales bacterium]
MFSHTMTSEPRKAARRHPTLKDESLEGEWPTPAWKREFRRKLHAWYDRHARDLEWRRSSDPYRVWVSEIMLQQTQVATVAAYFPRFLAAFPTIEALAAADEHDVLRLWEGLGYYRRARQLHRAAQIVVREHGGRFPADREAVRRLPGIGRYTAGAILSIAFDAREPIVEANTIRLLSRLIAYRGDPRQKQGTAILWKLAEELLPQRGSSRLNQALMELGSLVCTPRAPGCTSCPVSDLCPTNRLSLQEVIPLPKAKPRVETVREALIVVRRGTTVLLRQRQAGERWAGLWDFPRFGVEAANGSLAEEIAEKLTATTGVVAAVAESIATLKHGVTRFRITLDCRWADCISSPRRRAGLRWVRPAQLGDFPMSTTGRKVAKLICECSDE